MHKPQLSNLVINYLTDRPRVNLDSFYRIPAFISDLKSRSYAQGVLLACGYKQSLSSKWWDRAELTLNNINTSNTFNTSNNSNTVEDLGHKGSSIEPKSFIPEFSSEEVTPLIVTNYVTKSYVCSEFWESLLHYVDSVKGKLVVIPSRYYNPTSLKQQIVEADATWIDPRVVPYLCWERFRYQTAYADVDIFADIRINSSTIQPLNSLKSMVVRDSIYSHVSQQLITGANSVNHASPIMFTTGTVSSIDAADNLAAKRSEHHVRLGFIVIDREGLRNVHASKDGSFTDLNKYYCGNSVRDVRPSAIVLGDIHIGAHDKDAVNWATRVCNELKPENIVFHDLFDGSSINPHTKDKTQSIYKSLEEEVEANIAFIDNFINDGLDYATATLLLVDSNHHDFIRRYLYSKTVEELTLYERELLGKFLTSRYKDIFHPSLQHIDYDYFLKGVDVYLGRHGDKGINGSRGSTKQSFSAGQRSIEGHSHAPEIIGGAERVGCLCKLRQPYNQNQLSNWAHSLAVLSNYGKIQHLFFRGNV